VADELSKLNFVDDLTEAKSVDEASRWSIDHRGDLEVWVTLSPQGHAEAYLARLLWIEYPGAEPPSIKFVDPKTGRLDVPGAWPRARGFRPPSFDICASWTREGFNLHPEWKNDARFKWSSHGNMLLKTLRTLQGELDESYEGRHQP
jgi:hypothetical protein